MCLNKGVKMQNISKMPVVVLPLSMWEELQNRLEDFEMANSDFLEKRLLRRRLGKVIFSFSKLKDDCGL